MSKESASKESSRQGSPMQEVYQSQEEPLLSDISADELELWFISSHVKAEDPWNWRLATRDKSGHVHVFEIVKHDQDGPFVRNQRYNNKLKLQVEVAFMKQLATIRRDQEPEVAAIAARLPVPTTKTRNPTHGYVMKIWRELFRQHIISCDVSKAGSNTMADELGRVWVHPEEFSDDNDSCDGKCEENPHCRHMSHA